MGVLKGDFIGFQLGKNHSSDLGIVRVSDGSRYSEDLAPVLSDKTVQRPGSDGTYFFNSYYTQKPFEIPFAFDSLTEKQLRNLKIAFNEKKPQKLIFDERPYKYYMVKISASPNLRYLCFEEDGRRIYKGEGTLTLIAYYPYAKSVHKWLDEYNNSNINEWKEASGLKATCSDFDTVIHNTANWHFNLFNPGDVETDFILKMQFINGSIGEDELINLYIDGDAEKQIAFSPLVRQGEDTHVFYNTANNLLEGYKKIADEFIKTGTLYNKHKIGGHFFQIPLDSSQLYITGLTQGNIEISYDYLYY